MWEDVLRLISHFHMTTLNFVPYFLPVGETGSPLTDLRILSSVNITVIDDIYTLHDLSCMTLILGLNPLMMQFRGLLGG